MEIEETILTRCKRLSPNITEYFDGMRYLGNLDDADQATPAYLTQLAVSMVLLELSEIGIVSNFEVEDFITDTPNFEAMFAMREKFDRENLYDYFKNMTNEQYSILCDILDNTRQDEDILIELAHYCCDVSPVDLKFGQILNCTNHWVSTDRFRKHLDALRRKMDNTDQTKVFVSDDNVEAIGIFLKKMTRRELAVLKCAEYLLSIYKDLNEDALRFAINNYDHEKLDPETLPLFALRGMDPDADKKEEPSFLKHHHLTVSHHIEYWENRSKLGKVIQFTKEHGIMILLSLILDKISKDDVKTEFKRLEKIIPTNMLKYLNEMVDEHYNNLGSIADAII